MKVLHQGHPEPSHQNLVKSTIDERAQNGKAVVSFLQRKILIIRIISSYLERSFSRCEAEGPWKRKSIHFSNAPRIH